MLVIEYQEVAPEGKPKMSFMDAVKVHVIVDGVSQEGTMDSVK